MPRKAFAPASPAIARKAPILFVKAAIDAQDGSSGLDLTIA
jgi:hypothetical protein